MPITIKEATDGSDFAICMAIRMEVFVREQGVSLDEEMDTHDQAATHYIAREDGAPIGTARTRVEEGSGRIERVAVRAAHRGSGAGAALMTHCIARLKNHPQVTRIVISAQTQARAFYEKLGFVAEGEEYQDAGIAHYRMVLGLGCH